MSGVKSDITFVIFFKYVLVLWEFLLEAFCIGIFICLRRKEKKEEWFIQLEAIY